MFENLNSTFSNFYNTSENLAVGETIVSFKRRVTFKQNTLKKNKSFTIQFRKLSDSTGYMYDVKVYLGKDLQKKAQRVTATNVR
jgi:flagellar hook assembly protein FlgD